ncbi:GNAT family N-acetyltransferase [Enemella evansiae]|uniref:GNAT family N-acetyltransferase n=1 Tax=Enemella evansiae TaxID=2016499 RepID=UPI00105FCCCB|nr:GNAT family N-acetyltransferase [Enemella evansiae]TDO92875.1 acyl-CoA synthetase (NDP forming) [Enemella evansiae]
MNAREEAGTDESGTGYPAEWEADVLLSDGSTAHLRPIRAEDEQLLVDFYARVSPESKYLRFFAPYPVLSAKDVVRFTHVDYRDRVALILTVGERMVAVGRYDRLNASDAEVAFLVEDSVQGKGVGQLLLEHLAEAARERGLSRFVAEVLPQNRRMVQVFADAGYTVSREFEDGMILVEFPISPTEQSREVMLRREHRAEATSVRRLLQPRSIAVVGPALLAQRGVETLIAGGFTGEVCVLVTDGGEVSGVPVVGDWGDLPADLDIVATLLPPDQVGRAIVAAAGKAFGLYLIHAGEFGGSQNESLVTLARAHGLRALGPDALGVINTDPAFSLNASPAPMPRAGVVSMFCQSSAVGVILLSRVIDQHIGILSFISSGMYADVTSNDVMHYWIDDEATKVCVLSLDRIGNPRKFTRIVRRLAMTKPVVLFSPGRSERARNQGAASSLHDAPENAIDAMFRQSGVIVTNRRDAMFDIAQILARQPLPAGERLRVVTNSRAMGGHIQRMGERSGLICEPVLLAGDSRPKTYAEVARVALRQPEVDSVMVALVDPFDTVATKTHAALLEVAAEATKPLIGVFADFVELEPQGESRDEMGRLPTFSSYADALQALSAVTAYARWRQGEHGELIDHPSDRRAAKELLAEVLADSPAGRELTGEESARLLAAYGIELVPRTPVRSLGEAIEVAERLGWNVVLKATADGVRGGPDLGTSVFRHLDSAEEMTEAWRDLGQLVTDLGLGEADAEPQLAAAPVVQQMMPPGVPLQIGSAEDASFGPIISLGVAGIASGLLGDLSYRVPPLSTTDAAAMVRDLGAAEILFGGGGTPPADVAAVEELLQRVAQLADDLPQVAALHLAPCIAAQTGVAVLGARITIAPTAEERDELSRSLG